MRSAAMGAASQQLVRTFRGLNCSRTRALCARHFGAAYNTAAGFIDGSTSEMGFNMF